MFVSEIKKILLHAFVHVFYQYTYYIKTAFLIPVIFTCSIPLHVQFIVITRYQFSLPRHFVQPAIVATDKIVNIHNNCIVLRDDAPL